MVERKRDYGEGESTDQLHQRESLRRKPKPSSVDVMRLLAENLKNRNNKERKADVEPEVAALVRKLDMMTLIPLVTMLIQGVTGRNLLGGELKSLYIPKLKLAGTKLGGKEISGQQLMMANRISYSTYTALFTLVGIDGMKLVRKALSQLSVDPILQGVSIEQLVPIAIQVMTYIISWAITLHQTGGDLGRLYQKYEEKLTELRQSVTGKRAISGAIRKAGIHANTKLLEQW